MVIVHYLIPGVNRFQAFALDNHARYVLSFHLTPMAKKPYSLIMRYTWNNGDGWIRGVLIWGILGLLFTVGSKAPAVAVMTSLVMGVLSGWAEPILVIRKYRRWMRFAVSFLGLGLMILIIVVLHGFLKGAAWLGLGALYTATASISSAIIGARMCHRLNQQYEQTTRMLRKRYPPPPARTAIPSEPLSAEMRDAFLACLPHDLRQEAEGFFGTSLIAEPFRTMDSLAPTHSCLSGPTFLPPGHPWPERNGTPMEFLCQIRLQDLPATAHRRPAAGLLSFFIDAEDTPWGHDENDATGFRVLFHPNEMHLQAALRPGTGKHPPLRKPLRFHEVPEFIPTSRFEDRYQEFLEQTEEEQGETTDELLEIIRSRNADDAHRVLSLPVLAQYDMDDDLQVACRHFGIPEDTRWTLLLQLTSDKELNWSWGDAGYLYFWVPADDLAAGRFDRCWMVLQCS